MSETKKVELQVIPGDAEISLDISGYFYKRIGAVYFQYISKMDIPVYEKIVQHIEKNTVGDLSGQELADAACIHTLLVLMHSIEKEFTDKGLDKTQEFEIPEETKPNAD